MNNAIEITYFFYQHYKFLLNFMKKGLKKPSLMDSAAHANGTSGGR